MTAHWNVARKANVVIVGTVRDLPQKVQVAAIKQKIKPEQIHGVIYRGGAYLVRANLKTVADVKEVIVHEAYGHGGLRGLMGDARENTMLEIFHLAGGVWVACARLRACSTPSSKWRAPANS